METVNVESELKIRPEEFEILYGQSLDKEIEVEDPSLIVKRQTEHQQKVNNQQRLSLGGAALSSLIEQKIGNNMQDFGLRQFQRVGAAAQVNQAYLAKHYEKNDQEKPQDKFIIKINSSWKPWWDFFIDIVLGFSIVISIFFLAYQKPSIGWIVIDELIRVLFITDIFFTFFQEFIDDRGNPVRDMKMLALKYVKSWFFIDLIAVIPLRPFGEEDIEYIIRLTRLLKLPNVLNLFGGKVFAYFANFIRYGKITMDEAVDSFTARYAGLLFQSTLSMVLVIYIMGGIWFWYQDLVGSEFAKANSLTDESSYRQCLVSSYYMLTTLTTVGYGDFKPVSTNERVFIIFVLMFGVAYFAYVMGSFNSAIADFDNLESGSDLLAELNIWMSSIEKLYGPIRPDIKRKIIAHYSYYWEKDRLKELAKDYWQCETPADLVALDNEYLKLLPQDVVVQVYNYLFSDFYYHFSNWLGDSDLKYDITPLLQPRFFYANQILIERNEKPQEIIFLLNGGILGGLYDYQLEEYNQQRNSAQNNLTEADKEQSIFYPLIKFSKGRTVIGDYNSITGTESLITYIAFTDVDSYAIPRRPFIDILETYHPDAKSQILAKALSRERYIRQYMEEQFKDSTKQTKSYLDVLGGKKAIKKSSNIFGVNIGKKSLDDYLQDMKINCKVVYEEVNKLNQELDQYF